jgi:hypothetical protein
VVPTTVPRRCITVLRMEPWNSDGLSTSSFITGSSTTGFAFG